MNVAVPLNLKLKKGELFVISVYSLLNSYNEEQESQGRLEAARQSCREKGAGSKPLILK